MNTFLILYRYTWADGTTTVSKFLKYYEIRHMEVKHGKKLTSERFHFIP